MAIRLGNKIRLTSSELLAFKLDTGLERQPQTIDEYNQARQDAADYWRTHHGSSEAEFLAALIEGEKIPLSELSEEENVDQHSPCLAGQPP